MCYTLQCATRVISKMKKIYLSGADFSPRAEKLEPCKLFSVKNISWLSDTPNIFVLSTFLYPQHFWAPNIFELPTLFSSQHFWAPNTFQLPTFLSSQLFWALNTFELPTLLSSQHFRAPNTFELPTFLYSNILVQTDRQTPRSCSISLLSLTEDRSTENCPSGKGSGKKKKKQNKEQKKKKKEQQKEQEKICAIRVDTIMRLPGQSP